MGEKITVSSTGHLQVPDQPIIPYIEGDGTGPDIWYATRMVLDHAVENAYKGTRKLVFQEALAGEKAYAQTGEWLPEATLEAARTYKVVIKGPLTTPVGGGIRSLNVALRQILDLYACVRPVRYIQGVVSPVKEPEKIDMIVFRENTEDLYKGIEWEAGAQETKEVIAFLSKKTGIEFHENTGIGIKPMSEFNTRRLVKMAIEYAIAQKRRSVTLVHKGNIMKYTEGAFKTWGYAVAKDFFPDQTLTEDELYKTYNGKVPGGKIVIKDRIADNMFQQVLLRPEDYDVIATPNLNGDYISDALAAQVGGLGLAPGANIGDGCALFEATHGTAPKYAGLDKVNPGSLILSGVMMLDHLGWNEAARLIIKSMESTILKKIVTYDLARQIPGATEVKCSEFGKALCAAM